MSISKVVFIVGWLLIPLPILMVTLIVYCIIGNDRLLVVFVVSALAASVVIVFMVVPFANNRIKRITLVELCCIVTFLTIIGILLSSIPIFFSSSKIGIVDAIFEAASGVTTNGGTIIVGIEATSYPVLLWRSMLQWVGGIWTIMASIMIIPLTYSNKGVEFDTQDDIDYSNQALPNVVNVSYGIVNIYIALTLALIVLYWALGMSFFDAINHAFTTVSTGGFSTHDSSLSYFDSRAIELVAVIFMIIGSLPFVALLQALNSLRFSAIICDPQVVCMISIVVIASGVVYQLGYIYEFIPVLFTTVSFMTGTGYALYDVEVYSGTTVACIYMALMIIGGCSNSTTCGIRIFRLQIAAKVCMNRIKTIVNPGMVFNVQYNGIKCSENTIAESVAIITIYFGIVFISILMFTYFGMDIMTAISSSISAISNVGPAMGDTIGGNMNNYYFFSDLAKIWMIALMIIGRLEFFAFIVAFTAVFKKVYPYRG